MLPALRFFFSYPITFSLQKSRVIFFKVGGGKQTVIAAAGAVGSGLQQAGMNRNLSESNQDKGGKGDNTGKPGKHEKTDQSGGEERVGPTVANAKAQDEGKK